jgi:U5 small nuclear ribonucleoprotein component
MEIVGDVDTHLPGLLQELGVTLTKSEMASNIRPLVKVVASRFFGPATGFVDALREFCPSPVEAARKKIPHIYTGKSTPAVPPTVPYLHPFHS